MLFCWCVSVWKTLFSLKCSGILLNILIFTLIQSVFLSSQFWSVSSCFCHIYWNPLSFLFLYSSVSLCAVSAESVVQSAVAFDLWSLISVQFMSVQWTLFLCKWRQCDNNRTKTHFCFKEKLNSVSLFKFLIKFKGNKQITFTI